MSSPILRSDEARTEALRHGLVGGRLGAVVYRQTAYGGYADFQDSDRQLVDLDLVLRLSTGVVVITPEQDGTLQGLSYSSVEPHYDDEEAPAVNAGAPWDGLIGQEIRDVGFGWFVSWSEQPESLWGIRLTFESGRRVVIVLGELDDQEVPRYHPDSMVVLFNESDLARYRSLGGIELIGDRIPFVQ
jgi:hypothetical protein